MSNFKVGDRVRINLPGRRCDGEEATVIGPLILSPRRDRGGIVAMDWVHEVELHYDHHYPADARFALTPSEMIPIYDGFDKVAWSECVWQPSTIQAGM